MISGARYHRVATSEGSACACGQKKLELTLGHESSLTLLGLYDTRLEASSKTEITDLQLAVGIDQQISGFQISVQDVGRVYVLG